MANEDYKLNTNILGVTTATSSTPVTFTTQKPADSGIDNIFNEFEKLAKSRGVTIKPEDFIRVVNSHPEVLNLPGDELMDALLDLLTQSEPKPEVQQQPVAVESSVPDESKQTVIPESSAAEESDSSTTVSSSTFTSSAEEQQNLQETIPSIQSDNTELNDADFLRSSTETELSDDVNGAIDAQLRHDNRIGFMYNSVEFSNMSYEEQLKEYKRQYAMNAYCCKNEEFHFELWNDLSEAERLEIIESYSAEAEKQLKKSAELAKTILSIENPTDDDRQLLMETSMLILQTATQYGLTVDEFAKWNSWDIMGRMAAMLETKKDSKNNIPLSNYEQFVSEKFEFVRDAMIEYNNKHDTGFRGEEICFEQIGQAMKSIPVGVAIQEKIMRIPEEKRTEAQKATLELFNAVPAETLRDYGTKYGEKTKLTQELEQDPNYVNASDEEKLKIKHDYILAKYSNDPQGLIEKINNASACADDRELLLLISVLKELSGNKGLTAGLSEHAAVDDATAVTAANFDQIFTSEQGVRFVRGVKALEKGNPEWVDAVGAVIQDKTRANPEKWVGTRKMLLDYEAVKTKGTQLYESFKADMLNPPKGMPTEQYTNEVRQLFEVVHEDAKIDLGTSAPKARSDVQLIIVNEGAKYIPVAQAMNRDHTITKLAVENQVPASSILQDVFENRMPKEQGLKELRILTDQIPLCAASNQAAIHTNLVNGKYEEVGVYVSSIIYQYDVSAQAEALAASYATGNVAIIEAATLQVDKMDQSVVIAMKDQIVAQLEAMEERHSAALLDEYAIRQIKKQLGFDVDTSKPEFKTKLEAYIAKLKSLPKSEMYRRIMNDMQSWPADIQTMFLEAIVKYCPQLFSMMLDKFGAKLLTAFGQLNIATKNQILMQMLKTPSKRSEAVAYIKANPNGNYSDDLRKLFDEIMDELIASGQIVEDAAPKYLTTGKSRDEIDYTQGVSTISDIGERYNWGIKSDIDGNLGLVS